MALFDNRSHAGILLAAELGHLLGYYSLSLAEVRIDRVSERVRQGHGSSGKGA